MTRSITFAATLAFCALGCQQENLQSEQNAEQRELAETQRNEQRELAEEQARERAAAAATAAAELEARTAEVQDEQQELNAANQELTEAMTAACTGVATPDTCPVNNAHVQSSRDVDDGVALTLSEECGTREEVQHRIECYRARATLRGEPTPSACLIDLSDENVEVEVTERNDRVVVAMTNDEDAEWTTRARNEARQIVAALTPGRANGERN